MQSKLVTTFSSTGRYIYPDSGYDGLSSVFIGPVRECSYLDYTFEGSGTNYLYLNLTGNKSNILAFAIYQETYSAAASSLFFAQYVKGNTTQNSSGRDMYNILGWDSNTEITVSSHFIDSGLIFTTSFIKIPLDNIYLLSLKKYKFVLITSN